MRIIIFFNLYAKFIDMESAESQHPLYISRGDSLTQVLLIPYSKEKDIYIPFSF